MKKVLINPKEQDKAKREKKIAIKNNDSFKLKLKGIIILCIAILSGAIIYSFAAQDIKMSVTQKPKIDVILNKGVTDTNLNSFQDDITSSLASQGISKDQLNFSSVDTSDSNVSSQDINVDQIINNWQKVGADTWTARNGEIYSYTGGGETKPAWWGTALLDPNGYQSVTYDCNFTMVTGGKLNEGICFNVTMNPDGSLNGYFISICNHANTVCKLFKFNHYTLDQSFSSGINGVMWCTANGEVGQICTSGADSYEALAKWDIGTSSNVNYHVQYENGHITVTANNTVVASVDDNTYKQGTYGFWGNNCEMATYMYLTNIKMSVKETKKLIEALRQPEWDETNDGAIKVMVNVDDYDRKELDNLNSSDELITRLLNENINLVSWGNNTNQLQFENLIKADDNRGIFVNNTDYNTSIQSTATYIKSLVDQVQASQYVIAGQPVNIQVSPDNITSNTTDSQYPNGKWKVDHDYNYFENPEGQYDKSGVYTDSVISSFDKPGKYTISYEDQQIDPGVIYAHRLPVASFNMSIQNGNQVTLTSTSYDLDAQSNNNGIAQEEWSYRKMGDANWTSGKLTSLDGTSDYIVKLRVQDLQGAWSTPATKCVASNSDGKPIASFNLINDSISIYQKLQVVDNSYDPASETLTNHTWTVLKGDTQVYTGTTPLIDYTNYGVGQYKMQLAVTNQDGKVSDTYSRLFEIKPDTTGPEFIADPTSQHSVNKPISVNLKFTDNESGFKSYKYAITNSSALIGDSTDPSIKWSDEITKSEDTITLTDFLKTEYIHIIATDNAGNKSAERVLGDYFIQPKYQIQIQAIDSTSKVGLSGATFNVTGQYQDGTTIDLGNYNATTNSDGKVIISDVPLVGIDKLTIQTTTAPDGYNVPSYKVATLDTSTYNIVVDTTKTSADLANLVSDDKQTVTLKVPMQKKTFNLNISNVDQANDSIKLNNSVFTLNYKGVELSRGTTANGVVTLSGAIAGVSKTDQYTLTQVSAMQGYTAISSTSLNVTFDAQGNLQNISQNLIGANNNVVISADTIGNIKVLNSRITQGTNFNIEANITDRDDSSVNIAGAKYKVLVEGDNNLNYTTEAIASDNDGNIIFSNLYGQGLLRLTFINEDVPGPYAKETTDRYITINIDSNGTITNTNASMTNVFDKVGGNTVYVKLNNGKKPTMNAIKLSVVNKDDTSVGIGGINFEVRKLIDNSLVGTGTTDNNGVYEIDNVTIDGTGDVVYKIIPTSKEQNGVTLDTTLINIHFDDNKRIVGAEQITDFDDTKVSYVEQNDPDAYKYVANVEMDKEAPAISGKNQLIINKLDSTTNTGIAGAKYAIKITTSQTLTVVGTSDANGSLSTAIPDDQEITLDITETEAPTGYKLNNITREIVLDRDTNGNLKISSQSNINANDVVINNDGNVVLTDRDVSTANAEVKFKINKTDSTGNLNLGGVEFKISEDKTGFCQTVTTDRNGYVEVPSAIISEAGDYTFTIEETKTIEQYLLPNEKIVLEMQFNKNGNTVSYAGETDISGTDMLLQPKQINVDNTNNEVDVTLPIKNEVSNSTPQGSIPYSIDLTKVDSKGNKIDGAQYDVEIRPYAAESVTANCSITDDIEIKNQILTKDTTTILLHETKAEVGYNLDDSLKVVSLYNDPTKGVTCMTGTTSTDLKVTIEDQTTNGVTQKIIHITIVTPDPTPVVNPVPPAPITTNINYNIDVNTVDTDGNNLSGMAYDIKVVPDDVKKITDNTYDIVDGPEIKDQTLTKLTTTLFLKETKAADGYDLDNTLQSVSLYEDDSGKIQYLINSPNVKINIDDTDTTKVVKITIVESKTTTTPTDPTKDGIPYSINISNVNSKGENITGAEYDVEIVPYATDKPIDKHCVIPDSQIIPDQMLAKTVATTISLKETKASDGYDLDNTQKMITLSNNTDGTIKAISNSENVKIEITKDTNGQNIVKITITTPDSTSQTTPTTPATFAVKLFNKSYGSWQRAYTSESIQYHWVTERYWEDYCFWSYNAWESYTAYETTPFNLAGAQKLLPFFKDNSNYGFNNISGTITQATTQLIQNDKVSDDIYEKATAEADTDQPSQGNSDIVKLYKDYSNKEVLLTMHEISPAYNFKKIQDTQVRLKFDANGKIASGDIEEGKDLEDFAVGGISAGGQTDNIKIPTENDFGTWKYDTQDIKDYNSIGTNSLYMGVLNKAISNPQECDINLKDMDTDENLPGGSFNVVMSEQQLDGSWKTIEQDNMDTDSNGNIAIKAKNTYADRKIKYYITQTVAPKVGSKLYKDTVQGTLKLVVTFDDDGNIADVQKDDVPSNMVVENQSQDNNKINVTVYNEMNNNFVINVTKLDENGNPLAGVRMNNVSTLITDPTMQTGKEIFEYGSKLTGQDGKTTLKVCLPTDENNNYYGQTVEYKINEYCVPENYRALDDLKIRVLYDAKGKVQQASLVSQEGDKNIVINSTADASIDVTIKNEPLTDKPSFQITTQDNEDATVKLAGAEYKIMSWDEADYEKGTLNLQESVTGNLTDNSGYTKIDMPNGHALKTIIYKLQEITPPNSYVANNDIIIKAQYDKDGKFAVTPTIMTDQQIDTQPAVKIIGQPVGSTILQLQIINELKPKFTININKYDTALINPVKSAVFKATSQVKQTDGSYANSDEERISMATDEYGNTKIGLKKSHNAQTVLYTIYEENKAEEIVRGTIEVTFDVYGNVTNATASGDYLKGTNLNTNSNYVNVQVNIQSFRTKIQLKSDKAQYSFAGASFTITNSMNEKNADNILTNSTGLVVETVGEVYKNKTITYTFHQEKDAKDYNKIDDFNVDITFDKDGNITACNPTNQDGKFAILATTKDENGIDMSMSINQIATDRQNIQMDLNEENNPNEKIPSAQYQITSTIDANAQYQMDVEDGTGTTDIGPDKGFAGTTITYTLKQQSVDKNYVANTKNIQIATDYDANGEISAARIVNTDDYVMVDQSCIGTKTLKLKTTNKRKIIVQIENSNQYNDAEKLANNSYTITSQKIDTPYSDTQTTDINGECSIQPGPYYRSTTVEYKISQNNQPAEFNKIPDLTFKITYDDKGKAISDQIPDGEQQSLSIEIPQASDKVQYDFKLNIKNEPLVTVGVQTVDSKNNNKILGGKFRIVEGANAGEVITQSDKIAHAGIEKSQASTTKSYSIIEEQAPLGYQYKNRNASIGTMQVTFDSDGHIIPGSIKLTDGYNYIKVLDSTDKINLYDIDLQISYDETQEFKVIVENQDATDNTTKLVSTFNAQLSDNTTATTTTDATTGYGNLQFGKVAGDTTQYISITQSNIQGNYTAVNTITMSIQFDGSSKITRVTPMTGNNFAICGNAYTIDSQSDYTIKITVKNNPYTQFSIQDVNDGNKQQVLQGCFDLTGTGIDPTIKMKIDQTGTDQATLTSVPKGQTVHYTITQTSVDMSYALIKPIDLVVTYDADGKITNAYPNSGTNIADSSAVTVLSYNSYNVKLQVLNKQQFSIYATAEDAFNKEKLSGAQMYIKETTYSQQAVTLTTDKDGEAYTQLGTNKPSDTLYYDVKVINIPTGYTQLGNNTTIEATVKISFGTDGSVISADSSNPLIDASIENGLAVNLTVKYIPLANMQITRIDSASKAPLSGKRLEITSAQMVSSVIGITDSNGQFNCTVGGINANNIVRYNIDEQNQESTQYTPISNLYVDVAYDANGTITNITPSDSKIIQASGEGTRTIILTINSIREFKLSMTNVDYFQPATRIGGKYQITSDKGEKAEMIVSAEATPMPVTVGIMYPGESVTYTIHQEETPQIGYETIPDVNFVVTYDNSGNISSIARKDDTKDDRILSCSSRITASATEANADIELGSKAQLFVKLKLTDGLYNQAVPNIGFKIKDETSGQEKKVDTLSDSNGILEIPVDSVYSNQIINYTITQTATAGGYKTIDPIRLVVQYDQTGTVNVVGTYLQNASNAELTENYTKNLYATSKLKGVQIEIKMNSKIGIGIEKVDKTTGKPMQAVGFTVQEKEITSNKVNSWNMITDANGEATNFDRDIDGSVDAIEYTIDEAQAPSGYRSTGEIQVILYFNADGRVIASKTEKAPENVNIAVATDQLIQMSSSKAEVHLKLTIQDDDKMTFKIVNQDSQISGLGIKGSTFNVSATKDGQTEISNQTITTDEDGIATLPDIAGPGNVKIYFNQLSAGTGYVTQQKNAGYIEINKAADSYTITYVDSTDGIKYDIDNQTGMITVYLQNDNNLTLNIYNVDITTKAAVSGSVISLQAQVGEKTDDPSAITARTDNVINYSNNGNSQFADNNGTLTLKLGNTGKFVNKKVVYTITEIQPPTTPISNNSTGNGTTNTTGDNTTTNETTNTDNTIANTQTTSGYKTIGSVQFIIEFDKYGRVEEVDSNNIRIIDQKKDNDYEASVWVGHGDIQGDYTVKILKKSTTSDLPIDGAKFNVDLSVDGTLTKQYTDLTTASQEIGGKEVEDGIAEIDNLNYAGKINLKITETGNADGYNGLGADQSVQVNFDCAYADDKDTNSSLPTFTNPTSDNNKVTVDVNNTTKVITLTITNDPVINLKITNKEENGNLVSGAVYNINEMVLGDPSSQKNYGPVKTNDVGEITQAISRTYKNQTILITLTQDKIVGFNPINPTILQVDIDANGKIANIKVTAGSQNVQVDKTDYNINVLVTNTIEANYPKLQLKLTKQNANNSDIKLKDAMFQIKVTPAVGSIIYKVIKTDDNGQINISNLVASGDVKIQALEVIAPDGYKIGDNNGLYTFEINKDDKNSTLTKVSSSLDDSLWNVDSANNLVELNIPNEMEGMDIAINKVDALNGMSIPGAKFKLVDQKTNTEYDATTDAKGIANFTIPKKASTACTYAVTETGIPQGYDDSNNAFTITVQYDSQGKVTNVIQDGTNNKIQKQTDSYIQISVPNNQSNIGIKPYNIDVINVDEDDRSIPIQKSEFSINIQQDKGSTILQGTRQVDDNGKIAISPVNGAGQINIAINETKTGDGYVKDIRTKKVSLQRDDKTGEIKIVSSDNAYPVYDSQNNKVIIYVTNKKQPGKYSLVINKTNDKGDNITTGAAQMEVKIGNNDAQTYTTNQDGKIIISNLDLPQDEKFDILITEKVAPDGYTKEDKTQKLTVTTATTYGTKQILSADAEDSDVLSVDKTTSSSIDLSMKNYSDNGDLYLTSDKYVVNDKYVERVSPYTTAKDYIANMKSNGTITISDASGNAISDDSYVGTTMIIKATKDGKSIQKTIVVIGDVNGDGQIKVTDITILKKLYTGKTTLDEARLKAADVNNDGKITVGDITKLCKAYAKLINL